MGFRVGLRVPLGGSAGLDKGIYKVHRRVVLGVALRDLIGPFMGSEKEGNYKIHQGLIMVLEGILKALQGLATILVSGFKCCIVD